MTTTFYVYAFEHGAPRREAEVEAESLAGAFEHFAAHRHNGCRTRVEMLNLGAIATAVTGDMRATYYVCPKGGQQR